MILDVAATDAQLLALYARRRSEEAFGQLVARHIDLVYSAALRQVRDVHLAQDVTQDVFILLAQRSASMDERVVLPVWLYKAACLQSRNAIKSAKRRRHHEMAAQNDAREPAGDEESDAWAEALPLLDEAIGALGETDRSAVVLRFFKGQSVKDVGAALGLSPNATSKRLERVLEKLRRFLARRKVAIGSGALAAGLAGRSIEAAPAGLAASVSSGAVQAALSAGATAGATGGGGGAAALSKGAVLVMASAKVKGIVAACVILLLTGGGIAVVWHSNREAGRSDSTTTATQPDATRPVAAVAAPAAGPSATGAPEITDAGNLPPFNQPAVKGNFPDYIRGGNIPVLSAVRFRVPRVLTATIQAEHFDNQQGVQIEAPGLTSLDEGDWVLYSGVDFSGGATTFIAHLAVPVDQSGKLIEVRLDKPEGDVIASMKCDATGGWNKWATQSTPLKSEVTGVHDVYLTFIGESVANLDWIKFGRKSRDAYSRIEAESYDDNSGAQDQGTFLSNLDRGDYLRYDRVDFGEPADGGPRWFHAMCGCRKDRAGGRFQVRIDGLNGPVVAELTVRDTGAFTNHVVQSASMTPVKGVHDVYLTFSSDATCDLDWFLFSSQATLTPEQPVRPDGQ